MAQHLLDRADVGSCLQGVLSKAVAEEVPVHPDDA
jgi:hypothetical protein